MTLAELEDVLDTFPQSLVGKSYVGDLLPTGGDVGWYLIKGDWLILIDFDRTIVQVIERD